MIKQNRATILFYFLLILSYITFSLILVYKKSLYAEISYEDRFVEYLGSLFLLVTGIMICLTAFNQLKKSERLLGAFLLFAGIVFIITAFEEISWGQRIIGFETQEKLKIINDQDEFNFHNIDKKFFDRLVEKAVILFVFFSTIMLFTKKNRLWGIKLPDVYLTLAFALIPFYHQYNQVALDFYHLLYLPIFVIAARGLYTKRYGEFFVSAFTGIVALALLLVHTTYNHHFPAHNNSANEIRETLFSMTCAFYALVIYFDKEKL
ncbi:MAG: hypothetical protein RBR68_04020 [Tenuifilaceae bacterium]|jgi:hypothetical protein|nr:hypothetical protein [Tenuifilaceae bacterium]